MEQRTLLGDEEMAKKLRVVAYARVSTKKDAQSTSLETQNYITSNSLKAMRIGNFVVCILIQAQEQNCPEKAFLKCCLNVVLK